MDQTARERPAASMGAAAQGEVDGRGWVRGEVGLCDTLWRPCDGQRPRRQKAASERPSGGGSRWLVIASVS